MMFELAAVVAEAVVVHAFTWVSTESEVSNQHGRACP